MTYPVQNEVGVLNNLRWLKYYLQEVRRLLIAHIKIPLYRQWFRWVESRDYPIIGGRVCAQYRSLFGDKVKHPQSICNAGLLKVGGLWITVFKNQTFTVDPAARKKYSDNDPALKQLYRASFSEDWIVQDVSPLYAEQDGEKIGESQGFEDARLFFYRDEIWCCATLGGHQISAWPCFGRLQGPAVELLLPDLGVDPPQKNWMPFEVNGQLYLEYSISPRRILQYAPESGVIAFETGSEQDWFDGIIHGGAPAVRLSEAYFLGVANVQRLFWYQERYYAAVFYLFEAQPPFRVKYATPLTRVVSTKDRVQYVTGMVLDESKEHLFLSFGVNDYDNWVVSVNVARIVGMLTEVRGD